MNTRAIALEDDRGTWLEPLARVHQGLPRRIAAIPDQQALDRAAAGHAMTQQPRWKDARIIDDQQVPSPQIADEVGELIVEEFVVTHDEQARATPLSGWLLRD